MKPFALMRRAGAPVGAGNTDDFSSNTIASYTQYANTNATWSISGGVLNSSGGSQAVLTRNGVIFADGEVSCIVTAAEDTGLALRLANNNNYYLSVIYDNSSTAVGNRNSVLIYKRVSGSFSVVAAKVAIPTFTRGTPTKLSFSATGTSLTVKVNDVTYITATDASLSAAGLCGMRSNIGTPHTFDSFTWP